MIHNYKYWKLFEGFGEKIETFKEELHFHNGSGHSSNLEINSTWDIEDAWGTLEYTAELEIKKSGIKDIVFSIKKIAIEIEHREYVDDDDDEGMLKTEEFVFDKNNINTDPKINVYELPYYLRNLEIDFTHSENLDGEIDLKKVKFEMDMGHIES